MALLGPTRLSIFGKSSHLLTRLLGITGLFIFEANFQLKLASKKRGFDFWNKERMKTMVVLLSYW